MHRSESARCRTVMRPPMSRAASHQSAIPSWRPSMVSAFVQPPPPVQLLRTPHLPAADLAESLLAPRTGGDTPVTSRPS